MEWLWGLALVPVLLCGLMCVGGVLLAAVGLRQVSGRRACCDDDHPTASDRDDEVTAGR